MVFKGFFSTGREYYEKIKNIYNTGKGIYDTFKRGYDLLKGNSIRNLLPHSREHYDRINKEGQDYAKRRHQEELERQQAIDIVNNMKNNSNTY